ncbi:pyridoxamine 5'-phosphate oxidase family protein [Parvibium lacunae]|uniref:Pyridoxamine 5'-phosphate oxidase family protein n=1 Tax=Parvibium lacunae TaxID=1888893 RepID=A0A368L0L8_9BURK|nr:pyridoxamine 5'-phosphate oxidase family protein [Parvibium lacunae]RCS57086.1 pyridoxamine 5'-phosphate oxidase family protein [Parvibium lacunae]
MTTLLPDFADLADLAQQAVLCWLATVDNQGQPNVSPKEIFAFLNPQQLVIANIASPQSVRNLQAQPAVCVSLIDIFTQKGLKLYGQARYVPAQAAMSEPQYHEWLAPLTAMTGGAFPIHGIIVVTLTQSSPIVAPSYRLFPAQSQAEKVASAHRRYGVKPLD